MDIPTIPGAVYSVVSPTACTITDTATGRVLETTEPNKQKDFRAFGSRTTLSDPNAIYVAASTFSAAPTIGSGGGGSNIGISQDQLNLLLTYASSEGRNVPLNEDGTFVTTVGHTYVVSTTDVTVAVTNADGDPLCLVIPAGQQGFVANTSICQVSDVHCTVTEVFRPAAAVQLSGGGVNITELLPVGYFNAHYLDNKKDSNLYITTGLMLTENWSVEVDFYSEITTGPSFQRVFGSAENYLACSFFYQGQRAQVCMAGQLTDNLPYNCARHYIKVKDAAYSVDNGTPYECEKGTNSVRSEAWMMKTSAQFRLFKVAANDGAGESRYFIPALDPAGVPCLFDQVTKTPVYASGGGTFCVGFTLEQAAKLTNLPAVGGSLSIALPSNWQEDSAVVEALSDAESKGWVIDYRTFDPTAAPVTTFSLRRVFVRRFADVHGSYVDGTGKRWRIDWCEGVLGAEPEALGFEPYRSIDAAVDYWELTPYVAPESENLLIEINENE